MWESLIKLFCWPLHKIICCVDWYLWMITVCVLWILEAAPPPWHHANDNVMWVDEFLQEVGMLVSSLIPRPLPPPLRRAWEQSYFQLCEMQMGKLSLEILRLVRQTNIKLISLSGPFFIEGGSSLEDWWLRLLTLPDFTGASWSSTVHLCLVPSPSMP